MDKVLNIALTRYYKALATFGYYRYPEVYKILLVTHIKKMLEMNDILLLSTEEVRMLKRAILKIFGTSCLFPNSMPLSAYCNKAYNKVYFGESSETPDAYKITEGDSLGISDLDGLKFEITWETLPVQYIAVPSKYKIKSIINTSVVGADDDIWYDENNTELYSVTEITLDGITYNVYYANRKYPMKASTTVTLQYT